jgi:hypothetical protein
LRSDGTTVKSAEIDGLGNVREKVLLGAIGEASDCALVCSPQALHIGEAVGFVDYPGSDLIRESAASCPT